MSPFSWMQIKVGLLEIYVNVNFLFLIYLVLGKIYVNQKFNSIIKILFLSQICISRLETISAKTMLLMVHRQPSHWVNT